MLLLLEVGVVGVFLSLDLFLFFLFWEIMLIPMAFPDRYLGPRAPHLCRRKIRALHHGRLDPDAGRRSSGCITPPAPFDLPIIQKLLQTGP